MVTGARTLRISAQSNVYTINYSLGIGSQPLEYVALASDCNSETFCLMRVATMAKDSPVVLTCSMTSDRKRFSPSPCGHTLSAPPMTAQPALEEQGPRNIPIGGAIKLNLDLTDDSKTHCKLRLLGVS